MTQNGMPLDGSPEWVCAVSQFAWSLLGETPAASAGTLGLTPDPTECIVSQLRRSEKGSEAYDVCGTEPAVVCDGGKADQHIASRVLRERIAFLFSVSSGDVRDSENEELVAGIHGDTTPASTSLGCNGGSAASNMQTSTPDGQPAANEEGEQNGRDSDAGGKAKAARSPDAHGCYAQFVWGAFGEYCAEDIPEKVIIFALRLFQRYVTHFKAEDCRALVAQYSIAPVDFPRYIFAECVSLARNYLGMAPHVPASLLTMHVQTALGHDVHEVTPMDFVSVVFMSSYTGQHALNSGEAAADMYGWFVKALLVILSRPTLMTLTSSEMTAIGLLFALSKTATTEALPSLETAQTRQLLNSRMLHLWPTISTLLLDSF